MQYPRNIQTTLDWLKENNPSLFESFKHLLEGSHESNGKLRELCDATIGLTMAGFEAGRVFERLHPNVRTSGYLEPTVHRGYTRVELKAAFDAVCNKENWKLPICSIIKSSDRDLVEAAIEFFAGCTPSFSKSKRKGDFLVVEAQGYYLAVGA